MRVVLPIALAALVLAAPAARAEGTPDLTAGRAAAARLVGERAQVEGERARLQARLDTLAREIAHLKARHDAGAPLFTDPGLDRRLKTAQALSARVDALTRRETGLTARLRAADTALLAAYDAALARARDALAHAAGEDRGAAQATVARLEAGRRAAAAALGRLAPADDATSVPAVNPATDDPQALEAQADLLRDSRDRLARRLGALKDRAARLERQQDLAGQMNGFLSETRLFDEQDRTASRMTTDTVGGIHATPGGASAGTTGGASAGGAQGSAGGGTAGPAPGSGTGSGTGGGGMNGPTGPTTPSTGTGGGTDTPQPVRQLTRADASATSDTLGRLGDDASLDDVQAQEKRLEALIHRLDGKARALDRKARSLQHRRP